MLVLISGLEVAENAFARSLSGSDFGVVKKNVFQFGINYLTKWFRICLCVLVVNLNYFLSFYKIIFSLRNIQFAMLRFAIASVMRRLGRISLRDA